MTVILKKKQKRHNNLKKKGIIIIKVVEIKRFQKRLKELKSIKNEYFIGINYNVGLIDLKNVPEWCDFVICQGKIIGKPHNDIKFFTDRFATRNFNPSYFYSYKPEIDNVKKILNKLKKNSSYKFDYNIDNLLKNYNDNDNGKIFDVTCISRAEPKRNLNLLIKAFTKSFKENSKIKFCLLHTEHPSTDKNKVIDLENIYKKYINTDEMKQNFYYFYLKDNGSSEGSKGNGMLENIGLVNTEVSDFLNLSKTYYFGEEIEVSKKYGANRTLCEALCSGLKILCYKYDGNPYCCSHKYINKDNSYQFNNFKELIKNILKIHNDKFVKTEKIDELYEENTIKSLIEHFEKYLGFDNLILDVTDNLKYRITSHARDVPWYIDGTKGGTSSIKNNKQFDIFLKYI